MQAICIARLVIPAGQHPAVCLIVLASVENLGAVSRGGVAFLDGEDFIGGPGGVLVFHRKRYRLLFLGRAVAATTAGAGPIGSDAACEGGQIAV